jgi:molybdopterin-guanine dinucleotide biosynthesis protein A
MNAIVTAGGEVQPGEPLYEITGGGRKSMINLNGKPMVQWVLDALSQTSSIERVIVIGLPPETDLDCAHPLYLLPDQGDMISNIRAGAREILRLDPNARHTLLVSGDLPGLRSEIVDWLICQVQDDDKDLYYTVIERSTMEAAFPSSRRTYIHLKDAQLCGGDMHCFRVQAAVEDLPFWRRLVEARKSPLRQASLLGYDTLFFLILRQLSLKDAEGMACKRVGITGRAIVSPYAEIGMDVDKPFQLEIMRDYLTRGHEKQAARAG